MANQSIAEQFSKGFADAIADIREKVVEEPWFGRAVTERDSAPALQGPEATHGQNEPAWPEARQQSQAVEHQPDHNKDIDLDR